MHVFLSHNHRDKALVTNLAAQLEVHGAKVWLDSWEIQPGDSIVGRVSQAIGDLDTFVVVWSENASTSRWVGFEWVAALNRNMTSDSVKIVPIVLDDTPLPPLLDPYLRFFLHDGDVERIARELLGLTAKAERLMAMQRAIEELGVRPLDFPGFGFVVACPKCGNEAENLHAGRWIDHYRDDVYAGVYCDLCGWNDGGEL